jgi:phosphatidylserine/phosphatidylglycerophosphate/cardiolipin synthase-like enzyme
MRGAGDSGDTTVAGGLPIADERSESTTTAGIDDVEAGTGGAVYAGALWRIRPILDHTEAWLARLPNGAVVTAVRLLPEVAALHGVYDQVALALHALASLGVLRREGAGARYAVDRRRLVATRSFRAGVRAGLAQAAATSREQDVPRLLAALPSGLPDEVVQTLRRDADDLRAAMIALITGAQSDITLISPFWDAETVRDLNELLQRRLAAGLTVTILGRPPRPEHPGSAREFAHLASALAAYPRFRALAWEEPAADDPFGTQTFHFKAIVADAGRRSYLGTANLTLASLRSRMELGVVLEGEPSARLARIVECVLRLARPYSALAT